MQETLGAKCFLMRFCHSTVKRPSRVSPVQPINSQMEADGYYMVWPTMFLTLREKETR
jgi:hypothetical protein